MRARVCVCVYFFRIHPGPLSHFTVTAMPHHNRLKYGGSQQVPATTLHMRHMWAARLQSWKPDMPPEWVEKTREDRALLPIADALMQCWTQP